MEDRILINGVWYVRETQPEEIILDDLTQTLNIIYENGNYSWEATRIYKDDGENFYETFDIEFTDKTGKPWHTEAVIVTITLYSLLLSLNWLALILPMHALTTAQAPTMPWFWPISMTSAPTATSRFRI